MQSVKDSLGSDPHTLVFLAVLCDEVKGAENIWIAAVSFYDGLSCLRLQAGKAQAVAPVVAYQEVHRGVAQAAHAVVEHKAMRLAHHGVAGNKAPRRARAAVCKGPLEATRPRPCRKTFASL